MPTGWAPWNLCHELPVQSVGGSGFGQLSQGGFHGVSHPTESRAGVGGEQPLCQGRGLDPLMVKAVAGGCLRPGKSHLSALASLSSISWGGWGVRPRCPQGEGGEAAIWGAALLAE